MTTLTACSYCEPDKARPGPAGTPVVIGLDTSLSATGIASSEGWCRTVGYTDKKNPITKLDHTARITAMRQICKGIVHNVGRPDLVVMETPALSRTGGGSHERGWLWWRIYEHLVDAGTPVGLISTNQRMLYATGKGAATKAAVVDAVARRWPDWTTGGDDNQADAVVLMAAGLDHLGHPLADMPKTHRAALDKAVWPQLAVTR
jgi:crossover junction endodeoxyribonuclease RuvC